MLLAPLLDDLAAGLRECLVKKSITDRVNLQPFVEDILRSRISRRVMAQHHIGLNDRQEVQEVTLFVTPDTYNPTGVRWMHLSRS